MKTSKVIFKVVISGLLLLSFVFINAAISKRRSSSNIIVNTNYLPDKRPDKIKNDTNTKDILAEILAFNNDERNKPSSEFRNGHVSPSQIKDYLKTNKSGFEIKLPGNTSIPSATIYKGIIYVSGGFGSKQYYAFDAKTGEKCWAIDLDDDGPSCAAIQDDIIVFNTESCTIFACDAKTGKELWSYYLGDPLMCMPTIANGKVYTAYPSNYSSSNIQNMNDENPVDKPEKTSFNFRPTHVLIAFDLKTGDIVWQKWIDGDVMSAPVAKGKFLYVTSFPGTLYKFRQDDGEILSAKAMRATSAPVISDDHIYLSQRSDLGGENVSESLTQINLKDPRISKELLKKNAPYLDKKVQSRSSMKTLAVNMDAGNGFSGGAPASSGWMKANENIGQSNVSSLQAFQGSRTLHYSGRNYNTMGDEIICTNPSNGKTDWTIKLDGDMRNAGGFMGTPPLSVNDNIILATYTGDILVLDAKSGKVRNKYETNERIRYQPVVEDGWIYVTTTDGKLIAINTENQDLTGWSTWGANASRTNEVD